MRKMLFLTATILLALSPLAASITVSSPNASSSWCIGGTYSITWSQSGALEPNIDIRLRVAGSPDSDPPALSIVDDTGNDGTYSWLIPASVAPGSYFIRVKTDTIVGDSPTFQITTCSSEGGAITVTSPNGAEWATGHAHSIAWTQAGTPEPNVDIRLRVAGSPDSDPPALSIVDDTPNDGSYSWTPACTFTPGNYFIRVKTDTVVGDSVVFHLKNGCVVDPGLIEKLKRRRYWEIKWPPGPDPCLCPEWKIPDFRDFREFLGDKFGGSIVLMKNGKRLQELGTFGMGRNLPGSVKANLSKRDFGLLKNGGARFSIAILDSNGSILNESELEGGQQGLLR